MVTNRVAHPTPETRSQELAGGNRRLPQTQRGASRPQRLRLPQNTRAFTESRVCRCAWTSHPPPTAPAGRGNPSTIVSGDRGSGEVRLLPPLPLARVPSFRGVVTHGKVSITWLGRAWHSSQLDAQLDAGKTSWSCQLPSHGSPGQPKAPRQLCSELPFEETCLS